MNLRKTDLGGSARKGILLLFLFSFCGIGILVAVAGGTDSLRSLAELRPVYIGIALALVAVDLLLGAMRNHIFVRRIRPGTSFRLSFRANVANMFMGAVTPSQGLGGPAQIAVLNLGGIPFGAAASVSVLNFIGTILFFGVGVSAALFFFHQWIPSGTIRSILQVCAGLFIPALLLLLAAIFKPSVLKRAFNWTAGRINRQRVRKLCELLSVKVDEYHMWCTRFLVKHPWVVMLSVVLTVILYLNKFTIYWIVARGLGLDVTWAAMFSSLYLLTFISYFAPSPGAGGVAEVATGILMAPLIPGGFLPLFTLLGRMFILFIPAGIGFVSVTGAVGRNMGILSRISSKDPKGNR